MKNYLNKLSSRQQDIIRYLGDAARAQAVPVYLVGGVVRDLILGTGNLDLDFVLEADAIKFAQDFARCHKAQLVRHQRFGTATVKAPLLGKIDFATARKETYPSPAHLPVVEPGGIYDDLFRRDFSINAMAISINRGSFGALFDPCSGLDDLVEKKIRVLHDLSVIDDPTRILRAFRFEQRLGFNIEPQTLALLKAAVKKGMLFKVNPHRLRDELILMLQEEQPVEAIMRLGQLAGLGFLDKKIRLDKKTVKLLGAAQKEILWFKRHITGESDIAAWLVYLMALSDSLPPSRAAGICARFALPKRAETGILDYKALSVKASGRISKGGLSPSQVYELFKHLSNEAIVLLKAKFKHTRLDLYALRFLKDYSKVNIALCGRDLGALGILPGPRYKKILGILLAARLNGLVSSREEELALVKKITGAR